MKKIYLLLVLLSCTVVTGFAQQRLGYLAMEWYNAQTQTQIQGDSVRYYYSGTRGGYVANEQYYYQYVHSPLEFNDHSPYRVWLHSFRMGPHIGYSNIMKCDSAIVYRRTISPNYIRGKIVQGFVNNDIDTFTKYSLIGGTQLSTDWGRKNHYTNGKLSSYTYTPYGSSGPPANNNVDYTYIQNSQGRLDSINVYNNYTPSLPGTGIRYSYNSNNNIQSRVISTPNAPQSWYEENMYLYKQNGLLDSIITLGDYVAGTALDTISIVVFVYNSNNDIIEQRMYDKDQHGFVGWKHVHTQMLSYNSSGLRSADTLYYDYYKYNPNSQGIIKRALREYQYDANGIVNEYQVKYWDSTNSMWGDGVDSLYGPSMRVVSNYDSTLSINNISANNADVKIYPVPAHGIMTINTTLPNSEPFEVGIYDIQGVLMRSWEEAGAINYTRTITTDDLPAGNYVLKISGKNILRTTRMVIVR